jgi:hypothetical protein
VSDPARPRPRPPAARAVRDRRGEPQAEAALDAHMAAELAEHDLAATMATMVPEPWLSHVRS